MMMADEFSDGKPWVDLSEEELLQGLKRFAGVDMQQTSDEDFRRQIFRVLKMDASVPIVSRVFMQKRALQEYLADSGLTEVVRSDSRQYTLNHGKVLVEAIAAGIETLEFRRKVGKKRRFDLVTHDPDALFNIIANQQRDQAVIEANDAERRQIAKRRDSRSMAAAGTKPQGRAVDEHDSRENAKAAGVKAERSRRYDDNECFVCGKQGHKQWNCPQSQQGKGGKGVHGQTHGQTPVQQQQSPSVPAQHTRSKTTGMAPASATPRASAYKTASKAVVTETDSAAPEPSRRNDDDYVYIRVPRERIAPVDYGLTETVQHQVSQSAGPQNAAPILHSVPVQAPAPASQQSCGDTSTISFARVSVLQPGGSGATSVDTVETELRLEALTQHVAGRLAIPGASGAAETRVLMDLGSGITAISEELVEALQGQPGMTQTALTQAFVGHARVVRSLGQECDIETQSCPLHLTIETRWGPVRFTMPFIVLPGGDDVVIIGQKPRREKLGIDVMAQLTEGTRA